MKYIQLIYENMTTDPRFSHMMEGCWTVRYSILRQSLRPYLRDLRPTPPHKISGHSIGKSHFASDIEFEPIYVATCSCSAARLGLAYIRRSQEHP